VSFASPRCPAGHARRRACARLWRASHPKPHCALRDADDSDVVLIPPIFNDIEQTLAKDAASSHG